MRAPKKKNQTAHERRRRQPCSVCGQPSGYEVGNRVQAASGVIICRSCRSARAIRPRRDTTANPVDVWNCARCGVDCARPASKGQKPRYCSKQCQVNASFDRRRAREKDAFVEDVPRVEVFEADGYRCYLCGQMTDRTKAVPHPKAPTVDHVIPLDCGGTHERANCRTACFRCNCAKQNRGGGEQFAFVLELTGA